MKKTNLFIIIAIISTSLFASGQKEDTKDGLIVFTSILPHKFLVESIGGDRVSVQTLVGPGKSPATYQPKPSQVVSLSTADILFTVGVPFEKSFIHKISNSLKDLNIIDTTLGIEKRIIDDHHHEDHEGHDHSDHEELDPHVWLSPVLAQIQAENILKGLIGLDPEGSDYYVKRYETLISRLNIVDLELRDKLAPYKGKILFTYHPSFGYFADEYGLIQEAIETGGKEPTPLQLDNLIKEAKTEGVKVIAVQPEFSQKSAEIIAEAIDGTVIILNPLNPNYIDNLKEIAEVIITAYK